MKANSLLRIFISLFFITLLGVLLKGEMKEMVQTLRRTRHLFFLISILLQIVAVWIISVRLNLFFKAQSLSLSLKETVELSFLGFFFNNFLPTSAGGDLVKAFFAYQKTKKKVDSFACVVGDRIVGLFSLVLMAVVGTLLLWRETGSSIKMAVGLLFLFSTFAISFLFNRRMAKSIRFLFIPFRKIGWDEKFEKAYLSLHFIGQNKKILFQTFFLSIITHVIFIFSIFMLILSLSAHVPLPRLFLVVPLVSTLSMVPSLNGLGIREGAFVYFLGRSIGKGSALALSILWLGILGILSFIGGILYLLRGQPKISLAEIK